VLRDGGFEVVVSVGDAEALLAAVDASPVDVAIIDIRMPPTHTDEGLIAAETAAGADAIDPRRRAVTGRRSGSRRPPAR
jgi:DNA-binding NarL/FixJ family response regulator